MTAQFAALAILVATALARPADDQTYADLANEVYYPTRASASKGKRGRRDVGAYHLSTKVGDKHHAVFVNDDKKEIVLAIRGVDTEDPEDMATGLALMFGTVEQLPRARATLEALKDVNSINIKEYDIIVTGHSLGGSLAMLAAKLGEGVKAAYAYNPSAASANERIFEIDTKLVHAFFVRDDTFSANVLRKYEDEGLVIKELVTVMDFTKRDGASSPHDLANFCSEATRQEIAKEQEQKVQRLSKQAAARPARRRAPKAQPGRDSRRYPRGQFDQYRRVKRAQDKHALFNQRGGYQRRFYA